MNGNRNDEIGKILNVERKALWWSVLGGNLLLVLAAQWILIHLISGLQLPPLELLRAILILLYLACWTLGSNFDAGTQRQVLWNARSSGTAPTSVYVVVLALIVAGILLLWANSNETYFAIALSIFMVINVLSWMIFVKVIQPIIQSSETTYKHFLPDRLEPLSAVKTYITGRWQWRRFAAMLGVILLLDAICLFPQLAHQIAIQIGRLNQGWPINSTAQVLPTLLVGVFMIVGEAWGWSMRLQVYLALKRARSLNRFDIDEVMENESAPEGPTNTGADYKLQNKRIVQAFELQLTFPKCLWLAHGTGLMACVTYLVDHPSRDTLQLSGIGLFIYVFIAGFVSASLGYAALMIARNTVLDALWSRVAPRTNSVKAAIKGWIDIVASLALFGAGMVALAMRVIL
jgi:hypothetical protein